MAYPLASIADDELRSQRGAIGCEGARLLGRFRTTRLLNRSRGTEAWLGTDTSSGDLVVIKMVPLGSLSAVARMRLEYEAEVLRKLESPWLTRVLETGREADRFCVVRPYVPGITLRQRLVRSGLDPHEALTVASCLFSALKEVHAHGVLHRDIRPANVIVADESPLTTAVVTDFSLGCCTNASAWTGEESLEAALYRSPEHAGALDCDVGECSDLYSAGIVLFECLAGRPPFGGDRAGEVLLEHVTSSVPELRTMGLEVPRALDELVQRLLRKDPRDRYQSAQAVLADLESIALSLRRGEREPACVVVGLHDRRPTVTEPAFVGRQQELTQIEEQIRQLGGRRSATVFVEAESGGGKTRLLAEVAVRGVQAGMWVLRGQGSEQVGQRPFQVFDGIVEELMSAAGGHPSLADALRARLGEHLDAVCAALPELAGAFGWEAAGTRGPEAFGETRSIQALSAFLDALGSEDCPALIIFDDCQWADEMTVKLLAHWHSARSRPVDAGPPVLLVAAFRSEEVPADHLLRRFHPALHLRLAPFAADELQRLLESMAGPLPAEAVQVVARLSDGSPFMASAVLRGMVESGALVAEPAGWRIQPLALADLQSSSRAAGFLSRRIELLPREAIEVLTVGAVLGKEFDLGLAAGLVELSADQAVAVLETARQRHLVWMRPDQSECAFVHDKIRAALLEPIAPPRRRELHKRVAHLLEREAPGRLFDLAYHFDAAGESERALPYALAAAEQARSRHSLEVAEQQYRIAGRGEAGADKATQYRIREGLGDVLMLRGRYDAAAELFESAAALAEDKYTKAQIRGKLGELAFKRGNMERAIEDSEAGLRLLGRFVPRRLPVFVALLAWEVLVQVLHTLLPTLLVHRVRREPAPAERLAMRLLSNLAHGCWYSRGRIVAFWAHLRGLNLAERYPPTLELAAACSEHAPAMTLVPLFRRAVKYAEKSLQIRKSFGDLWGQGQSLHYHGVVLYAASRFAECIEKCREAVRLLERMGDYWQVHIARYQIAASLYHLGDLQGALREAQLNHKSGLELGDEQASGIILDVWGRATGGSVPQEILKRERDRKRHDAQGTAQVLFAEGLCLLGGGEAGRAAAVLETAIQVVRRAGVNNAYTLPILTWLATARRRQAEQERGRAPQRRRAVLRRARAAARRAVRAGRLCKNDLPQALREYALILTMRGRVRRARRLFDRSLRLAERHGARHEWAETLLARGEVGRELGWPDAEKQIADARAALAELGATASLANDPDARPAEPVTLSLADRFETVLDSGRRIAAALSRGAIFDEVRAAALRLLRGECCAVLAVDPREGRERLSLLAGEIPGGFHEPTVLRALGAGRAAAFVEEIPDNGSAGSPGERSALCVLMRARGRAVACLYVTHRQVRGLFGPDEERLADFIATLAGAALENAEGFEELQRLNETLEQRVAERTAAAEARAAELAQSNQELERLATELREAKEKLRVAKEAAETASLAKSRFLAAMSHEIRTPINGITGMTELALATPLSTQQRNYLNAVKQSANALLTLLNDILDFSKIEAGRMELEKIPFRLRDVVGDAVQVLAVPASQKGLELVYRVAPDAPEQVLGDPGRLRQILVNLVGNAIKFTERGEVVVDVRGESPTTDAALLHFAVRDTGIGIPAEKRDCIFEAFRQCDSSTTRRFGGTGLGLTISAQIVHLLGGRMWVESEVGQGSTFHFAVPLHLDPAATREEDLPAPLRHTPVLVVAPHAAARRAYCDALEGYGLKTTAVDNPATALHALRAAVAADAPFRVALVDVGTAHPAFWNLAEEIRRREGPEMCPVVLMLPAGLPDGPERAGQRGIGRHAIKPPKPRELLNLVLAALQSSPAAPSPPESCDGRGPARRLHVLLADDAPVNQEVAAGLLELRGHSVEVVGNGREALDALGRRPFDVVLLDIEMPGMDGLEATAAIRAIEETTGRHTPIIAMTAHALKGFRERCIEAGMDGYVSKPIQPAELYEAIESAAARAPGSAAGPRA